MRLIIIAANEKSATCTEDTPHCSLSTRVVFKSSDIPYRQRGPREHTRAPKRQLVTCFSYTRHPKIWLYFSIFTCCEIQRRRSSPTHQTCTTCHKSAALALAPIRHFHTALSRTPPGHGMLASAGKCTVSLPRCLSHSRRFTASQIHRQVPNRQTDTTCRSSYGKHHTYTKSPTKSCVRKLPAYINAESKVFSDPSPLVRMRVSDRCF